MRGLITASLLLFLAACAEREVLPVSPDALAVGKSRTVFVSTSRAREPDGRYRHRRSESLDLLELTISIPPSHVPGQLRYSRTVQDPGRHFALADQTRLSNRGELARRIAVNQKQNRWPLREVTIFVHGYNSTQTESAFRAAQFAHDVDLPSSVLMYSWPSRGQPFAYAYDLDSVLFARDGLEQTVRMVRAAGADRIVLAAHSMGAAVSMEMLRQAEIREPGWSARTLDGVFLIAPDLDIEVFKSQFARIRKVPEPFVVIVSEKDPVLSISAWLRGTDQSGRLGNTRSTRVLADLPITVLDTTEFSSDAGSPHFVAATSPALISIFRSLNTVAEIFEPVETGLTGILRPTPPGMQEVRLQRISDRPGEDR